MHRPWMISLSTALGCLILLSGCQQESIPMTLIKPIPIKTRALDHLGVYRRMVPLETRDESILGEISKVVVDPTNGDLLVGDLKVTYAVYRFNSEGRFLFKYGGRGEGPGEYQTLNTFAVRHNGQVALFSMNKRLLFAPDGRLLEEVYTNRNDFFATEIGETLYVYSFKGLSKAKTMITSLDERLHEVDQFHPYEPLMERMLFIPLGALCKSRGELVVNNLSDFGLTTYSASGERLKTIGFPNLNGEIEHLRNQSYEQLTRMNSELAMGLHRANAVFGVDDLVFILETRIKDNLIKPLIWDRQTDQVYAYPDLELIRAGSDSGFLSMDGLVGSYHSGLIGICDDPDNFAHFKDQYPMARDIEYRDTDNPILLFFELKKPNI